MTAAESAEPSEGDGGSAPAGPAPSLNPASWDLRTWAWIAAALAAVVYVPSLWNGLTYDDVVIITENEGLRSWRSWGELLSSPYWPNESGRELGLWRPTTTLLLSIVWQASGGAAVAFHLTNLVLHAIVTFLVVRVAGSIVSTIAAGLAGVFFAIHPVHVEAVANGVGMAELLAAALVLASLIVVLQSDRLGAGRLALVLALFALGFGAKESAVVLPGLVFVLDAVRNRLTLRDLSTWVRDRGALLGGLVAVTGGMLWLRVQILGEFASALPPLGGALLQEVPRIWTLGEVWYQMLRVLAIPTWLSPDYSPELIPIVLWWTPRGMVGVAGVFALLLVGWFAARRLGRFLGPGQKAPDWVAGTAMGVGWFVAAVSPVSNLVVLTGILLAERTLYLPSVGTSIAVAAICVSVIGTDPGARVRRVTALSAVVFVCLAWGVRTVTYIPVWRDNPTLFAYTAQYIPESIRAQLFRGDFRATSGDEAGALPHFRYALRRANFGFEQLLSDGVTARDAGQLDVARVFLVRAAVLADGNAAAHLSLANLALMREDAEEAEYWARGATEIDTEGVVPPYLLSVALERQERWAEAGRFRAEVARRDSARWEPWRETAGLLQRAGDVPGALSAIDSAQARTRDPQAGRVLDSLRTAVESTIPPFR